MNEPAIWKLAGQDGMAALTTDRLAIETGQNPIDLTALYPDSAFMVLVLMESIHAQALSAVPLPNAPIHDRLTDMVMAHLDACVPYRLEIRRLWGDLVSMPTALLTLRPYFMKMVDRVLTECGFEENALLAPLRLRAYSALILYVLYVWVYDESPQQEHTLVTLDRALKKLGDVPW